MFLDLNSRVKSLHPTSDQYLHKAERSFPSSVSILTSFANGHFSKVVIDTVSFLPPDFFLLSLAGKERIKSFFRKYYTINLKDICLSSSIKTFTLYT